MPTPRNLRSRLAACFVAGLLVLGLGRPAARAEYVLTTLATFDGVKNAAPYSTVTLDAEGNLYGTTVRGGAAGLGTIYRIDARTGALSTVVEFDGANGSSPSSPLLLNAAGNLVGTAKYGSPTGLGSLFEVDPRSGEFVLNRAFNASVGSNPQGRLTQDQNGVIYGTAQLGGVFAYDPRSFALGRLTPPGGNPFGSVYNGGVVRDASGNLFGVGYGPTGSNTFLYEIGAADGQTRVLKNFDGPSGFGNESGLAFDASGRLYGAATFGGALGFGTIYRFDPRSARFDVVFSFDEDRGAFPWGPLTSDALGNIYGTTYAGGTNADGFANHGTVFRINGATGAFETIYRFSPSTGVSPFGGVTLDGLGNLYGTTQGGGPDRAGTVFRLSVAPAAVPGPAAILPLAQAMATGLGLAACRGGGRRISRAARKIHAFFTNFS